MNPTPAPDTLLEERCRRLQNQVSSLKNVTALRKTLLELREKQVKDLISKLKLYEVVVTEERETRHSLSRRLEAAETQCGQLTARLTQNIQTMEESKENYENKVATLINELQTSEKRNQQLSDQLNCAQLRISEVTKDETMEELNARLMEKDKFIKELEKQMKKGCERNKVLSYQMSLLNNLFKETEGVTIDFEKIKAIGDIVRESQSLAEDDQSDDEDSEKRRSVDLEDLLDSIEKSEQIIPDEIPGEESCYKSVDTKKGPQLVLSVSKTFIKLKDLILEKKSLQNEIETLKTLNTKLESKVDKQEHRLYKVTVELNKTWSLVSKLKQQHKRLFNSEAALRYELQEKRALLEKLKNELSASRDKWRRARQKNSQSQIEWQKLRDEFAKRKETELSQESGTFSEVMSLSSGDNEATTPDEEEAESLDTARSKQNISERPKTLPLPSLTENATTILHPSAGSRQHDEDEEATEEDFEEGTEGLTTAEEENVEDPLEELVSELVEEIDNEVDTEEETSTSGAAVGSESSPSPDFEDRMRRRANRLRVLEEQCHVLHNKLAASTERSVALSSKLARLHDHYGASGSSTGTPSDESQPELASQTQEEASSTTNTEIESPISASENNSIDKSAEVGAEPEFEAENMSKAVESENHETSNKNGSKDAEEKGESSHLEKLIDASENSSNGMLSIENNNKDALQHSQGQNADCNGATSTLGDTDVGLENPTTTLAFPFEVKCSTGAKGESQSEDSNDPVKELETTQLSPPTDTVANLECGCQSTQCDDNLATGRNGIDSQEAVESMQSQCTLEEQPAGEVKSTSTDNRMSTSVSGTETEGQETREETIPVEEHLPIQQHFPSPADEEANEFAPVQIRPEFLRILQEADEATNANSLDWMPSLLSISHSVALLRLDPVPQADRSNSVNVVATSRQPLSESLRIEIPQQFPSPSPPPVSAHRRQRQGEENVGNDESISSQDEEDHSAMRKDPSFLSRMIIKQLPKRLRLLKNENHMLQMEATETKMRMKEMNRQLSKELHKHQELAISLDAQIEDKNLVEFELREELEKKEKVIEELQIEINESKEYVDEIKKEKDEMESYFKVFIDEKIDLDRAKVSSESVKDCYNCKRPFSFLTRRKHHCKICGRVFCKDCAIQREPFRRSSKRPRLCTRCHFRRQRLITLVNATKQSALQKQNESL